MLNFRTHFLIKIICIVLITAFVTFDVIYANPPEYNAGNSTLASPTPFPLEHGPVTTQAARSQESVFLRGAIRASICSIGDYYLGTTLPDTHGEEAVRADFGRFLNDTGVEIVNIVCVEQLVPEKLKAALNEVGFKMDLPDKGVVFALYKKRDKKFLVLIAKKDSVSPECLPGDEWPATDKYIIKYLSEDYDGHSAIIKAVGDEDVPQKDAPDSGKSVSTLKDGPGDTKNSIKSWLLPLTAGTTTLLASSLAWAEAPISGQSHMGMYIGVVAVGLLLSHIIKKIRQNHELNAVINDKTAVTLDKMSRLIVRLTKRIESEERKWQRKGYVNSTTSHYRYGEFNKDTVEEFFNKKGMTTEERFLMARSLIKLLAKIQYDAHGSSNRASWGAVTYKWQMSDAFEPGPRTYSIYYGGDLVLDVLSLECSPNDRSQVMEFLHKVTDKNFELYYAVKFARQTLRIMPNDGSRQFGEYAPSLIEFLGVAKQQLYNRTISESDVARITGEIVDIVNNGRHVEVRASLGSTTTGDAILPGESSMLAAITTRCDFKIIPSDITPAEEPKTTTPERPDATQLFDLIEAQCNNNYSATVKAVNNILPAIAKIDRSADLNTSPIGKTRPAAEIKHRIRQIVNAANAIGKEQIPEDINQAIADLNKGLDRLDADVIAGKIIALARNVIRDKLPDASTKKKLLIGIGTSWIPGYEDGKLQFKLTNPFLSRIKSKIENKFRSEGLNVEVIIDDDDAMAWAMVRRANDTGTGLQHAVAIASKNSVENSKAFSLLLSTETEKRACLVAIDPSELFKTYNKYGEDLERQLDAKVMEAIAIALDFAVSGEIPNTPAIDKESSNSILRILVWTPHIEMHKYRELQSTNEGRNLALAAA